ncbi:glycosyltransferase [Kitasatospora phosalacinea]|uniref:glycosyltransferase n=1 Tax=Kitasatospora phosalacinea TaxID=2065 RepID=UPI00365124EC
MPARPRGTGGESPEREGVSRGGCGWGGGGVSGGPAGWWRVGSAAMEAMGVGVPLVCADVAALRETVGGSEECALLVPPERPEALAGALVRSLEERGEALVRAKAARARFLSGYTLERVSAQMVEFYGRALA